MEMAPLKKFAALLICSAALISCSTSEGGATPASTTGPATTTGEVSPTTVPTTTTAAPPAPTTAADPAEGAAAGPMPEVVCLDLQSAQDLIQKRAGVFLSLSEDATGAGRQQIIDRNWVVVAQRPAAGTPIGEGDAVLSVVKQTEDHSC